MKRYLTLAALVVASIPSKSFGEEYKDKGVPLHGDPTQGGKAAEPAQAVDKSKLTAEALKTTTGITESGGAVDTELGRLLAEAAEVKEGTALPKKTIVEIRQHLGSVRSQNPEKVDAEINRLEAIILGLEVDKGKK